MKKADLKLARLRRLEIEADAIRRELGISRPGVVIYQRWRNPVDDELVLVEADGFGGATLMIVEGNYPIDYLTGFEQAFETEYEAQGAAENIS